MIKIKPMKRRKWPLAKKRRVLTERKRHAITVKKVCQKYDISYPQYYKWWKLYGQDLKK